MHLNIYVYISFYPFHVVCICLFVCGLVVWAGVWLRTSLTEISTDV